MYITVVGLGFTKKFSLPSGSTLADLKEKLENPALASFTREGVALEDTSELHDEDTIMALPQETKVSLG